jgi:hypothetical protein
MSVNGLASPAKGADAGPGKPRVFPAPKSLHGCRSTDWPFLPKGRMRGLENQGLSRPKSQRAFFGHRTMRGIGDVPCDARAQGAADHRIGLSCQRGGCGAWKTKGFPASRANGLFSRRASCSSRATAGTGSSSDILRLFYGSSTALLRLRYTSTAALLRLFYGSATALLQICYDSSTAPLRSTRLSTALLRLFYGSSTALLRLFYGSTGGCGAGKTKGFLSPQEPGHRTRAFGHRTMRGLGLSVIGPCEAPGSARVIGPLVFRSPDHARTWAFGHRTMRSPRFCKGHRTIGVSVVGPCAAWAFGHRTMRGPRFCKGRRTIGVSVIGPGAGLGFRS